MKRQSLIDEINELLISFSELEIRDAKAVLGWFYKAIYYNSMYDNEKISSFLYGELASIGYESVEPDREYIKSFYKMLNKSTEMDDLKIANALISQIMAYLKQSRSFDESLNSYIKFYNEKFNSAEINKDMMKALRENIGSKVVFVRLKDGNYEMVSGTIDALEEYKAIIIDQERYPFIGYNTGIKTIYSIEGKYLYNNELLSKNTNLESFQAINELNYKTFGESYKDSQSKLF